MNDIQKIINFTREKTTLKTDWMSPEFRDLLKPRFISWPDVALISGAVFIGPDASTGDVLHELGHVATTPARLRPLMNGFSDDAFINAAVELEFRNDSPANISSDDAASFWGWCVAKELGLDDSLVFQNGYEFTDTAWGGRTSGLGSVANLPKQGRCLRWKPIFWSSVLPGNEQR